MTDYDKLLDDLRARGARLSAQGHVLEIAAYGSHEFVPPVRLHITRVQVESALEAMSADAAPLWPDTSPETAAYYLLLEHLATAVEVRARPGAVVRLSAAGVQVDRERRTTRLSRRASDDGPHHWSAEPPA